MPQKLDEIYQAVKRKLSGKTNPKTKKKYTDSDFWAIARAQYNKMKKEFEVSTTITKSWEEKVEKDGEAHRFIEATVSGLKEDRDGEMFSQEAIDDMIMQFKSGTIPFFPDHGRNEYGERIYSWKQIMGKWVDAYQEGDHLKAVVKINNAHPDADLFWSYVQEGMPIGFSIGGKPLEEPKEVEVEASDEPEIDKSKKDIDNGKKD